MNKITVSNQGCEDSPTLGSIEPGTIFCFESFTSWKIKANQNIFVSLDTGVATDIVVPSTKVIPLVGSICIEPEK